MNKINFKKAFFLLISTFFIAGIFSSINIEAQGRTCCTARTGTPVCDYCATTMTKTNTIVPASEGADYYGCGGITVSGFTQYDSGGNAICRVCPAALPYSLACTLPSPPVAPPNPRCGGACTTNSQCPLVDGRVRSVCHPFLHICVNPNCPDSSELGSQCYCTVSTSRCGDKCGNWPEGKYPLCSAGSTCAPTNGPLCTGLANTFCQPVTPGNGYTRPVCGSEPLYRYLQRPNGTIANSQADVLAACVTCTVSAPGAAILNYPAYNQIISSATATLSVTTTIDVATNGWGSGCPANINTWTLTYRINSGAWQTISSNIIPNIPVGSTVDWYVTKFNGSLSTPSTVSRFTVVASCIPSAPSAATPTFPANNSDTPLLIGNSVNVGYTLGSWGVACTGSQTTTLQVSVGCTGAYVNNPSSTLITGLAINDNVCWRVVQNNGSLTSTSAVSRFRVIAEQKAWLLGYNGNVSAKGGIIGLSVPNSITNLSSNLNGRTGTSILTDLNSVYTSTYGFISGTNLIPLTRQSKMNEYVFDYSDLSIKPPLDSGFTNWYEYLYDLVSENSGALITTLTGNQSIANNGQTSTLAGAANTKHHVLINGNLVVGESATCNTQTIFFVTGTITFNPDFTVSSNSNGCIFVSQTDITIAANSSNYATPAISSDSSQLANYDLIEASLIANGALIIPRDVRSATEKGDGIAIKGSITTSTVNIQRDINLNGNQLQPAYLFIFDPRYREIFKNDIDSVKYSIREVGYTSN